MYKLFDLNQVKEGDYGRSELGRGGEGGRGGVDVDGTTVMS